MRTAVAAIAPLVCLFSALNATGKKSCEAGWFGPECQYKCRCSSLCDANGHCRNNSKCETGWFGPACQYYDIARDSAVSLFTNVAIADDDEVTCSRSVIIRPLTYTWSYTFPFTWLRLSVSNPDLLKSFQLILESSDVVVSCRDVTQSIIDPRTLDIHCSSSEMVNKVTLVGKGVTRLCYVHISGGRNVAIKQRSSQSSNYTSNTETPESVRSSNSVDGRTIGDHDQKSCSHTKWDNSSTWHLSLSSTKQVSQYVLYNRDILQDRIRGFLLQSFNDNNLTVFEYPDTGKKNQLIYHIRDPNPSQLVKEIKISLLHYSVLTMCEVEAYGDSVCPLGRYGRDCEMICRCEDRNEKCFVSTGNCPSGCAVGYQGEGCREECNSTTFGIDCKENCSQDCLGAECHHVTGTCNECPPGKFGSHCERNCGLGTYGSGCIQTCSENCAGGQGCSSVSGACVEGCKSGYVHPLCDTPCGNATYGQDCQFKCSQQCVVDANKGTPACHHESGVCLLGCVAESEEAQCLKPKTEDSGYNPGAVAGPIVVVLLLAILVVAGLFVWRRQKETKCCSSLHNGSSRNTTESCSLGLQMFSDGTNESTVPVDTPELRTNKSNLTRARNISDNVYCNITAESYKTAIAVDDLNQFILSHTNEYFVEQFKSIPSSTNSSMSVGLSNENKNKNRYKNICAYDHSRVQLIADQKKGHGDYINASFLQGYNNKEKFIASQGPTKVMLEDFIRMLWEQQSDVVVMLTNLVEQGKPKCEQYWPEEAELVLGEITMTPMSSQVFADFTIRKIQLSKANETPHTLTQFHYISWPDKDVPANPWSLVDFVYRVASAASGRSPIVVHCSAGVGRTGTFIALHSVIRQADDTGFLDFYSTVSKLRQDRVNMIQTVDQYIFLHKAARYALICLGKTVTTSDIVQRVKAMDETTASGQTNIEEEFKALCNVCSITSEEIDEEVSGESESNVYGNSHISNRLKNRFSNILPKESYRPHLFCETEDVGEYINAVFLPSLTNKNGQILTQLPLPSTILDFWRMVTQCNVSLIVAFEVDSDDSTVGAYLQPESGRIMECGNFKIETKSRNLEALWEEKVLSIKKQKRKRNGLTPSVRTEECHVTHLKCTKCDLDPEDLLALAQQVRLHSQKDESIVLFMCRNGADYSGLVCVMSALLERMDSDHALLVPLVVGTIKNVRPQVIPTLSQYRMLYQALKLYSDSLNTNSNSDSLYIYSNSSAEMLKMAASAGISNCAFDQTEDSDVNIYANF